MRCPKCASEAPGFHTHEGVVVNFCRGCSGLWFDHGELSLYGETERDVPNLEALLPHAQVTAYVCPHCPHRRLVELPYLAGEEVLIDWCPACHGAWLDAREIVKVEHLATRYEPHTARLLRGVSQLETAGYTLMRVRRA